MNFNFRKTIIGFNLLAVVCSAFAIEPFDNKVQEDRLNKIHRDWITKIGYPVSAKADWLKLETSKFRVSCPDYQLTLEEDGFCSMFKWLAPEPSASDPELTEELLLNMLNSSKSALPKLPRELIWKPKSMFWDDVKNLDFSRFSFSFTWAHTVYPVYPSGLCIVECSIKSKKITKAILSKPRIISTKSNIQVSQAIKIATEFHSKVRKLFPRKKGIRALVGPMSPKLVLHSDSLMTKDFFIDETLKQIKNGSSDQNSFPFRDMYLAWNGNQTISEVLYLSWLINVEGDVCCVSAETGLPLSYRYAEMGPYFTFDKKGNLIFN